MTVSADKLKISPIGIPVPKSARPIILTVFGSLLAVAVYMVYVQNADVITATARALPTKFCNQLLLSLPMAALFLEFIAVLVPKCLLTPRRTKLCLGRQATLGALASMPPSVRVIAGHAAKLAIALLHEIGRGLKWVATLLTDYGYLRSFSHAHSITHFIGNCNPQYFAIAVKRIGDALKQPRLL